MDLFQLHVGDGPIVAAAIHDGHLVSPAVEQHLALDAASRLREEDPFTGLFTQFAATRFMGARSRFEFDLNRPRDKAVYLSPDDAWGLDVWKSSPPMHLVRQSLAHYDHFYEAAELVLRRLTALHKRVVVLDLHSYNHCREGHDCPPADVAANPEVNVGTGAMDRERWAPIVDGFMTALAKHDFLGRRLDVRENVRFRGGEFCRWIHRTFPTSVCAIAVEFKKFFMDEWTGQPDRRQLEAIQESLAAVAPLLLRQLSDDPSSVRSGATPGSPGATAG